MRAKAGTDTRAKGREMRQARPVGTTMTNSRVEWIVEATPLALAISTDTTCMFLIPTPPPNCSTIHRMAFAYTTPSIEADRAVNRMNITNYDTSNDQLFDDGMKFYRQNWDLYDFISATPVCDGVSWKPFTYVMGPVANSGPWNRSNQNWITNHCKFAPSLRRKFIWLFQPSMKRLFVLTLPNSLFHLSRTYFYVEIIKWDIECNEKAVFLPSQRLQNVFENQFQYAGCFH